MERQYESMLIIRPDLGAEEKEEVAAKISSKIEALDGKVSLSKLWAKERNFFFLIRSRGAEKKKYYEGAYWLMYFALDTQKLPDLKEVIRLEERILRNVIFRREVKEVKNGESQ